MVVLGLGIFEKGVGMARQARVKVDEKEAGVYHLCSRVAGQKRVMSYELLVLS